LPALASPADEARLAVWRALRRVKDELRALQLSASAHPLAVLRDEALRAGCIELARARERDGSRVQVACLLAAARRVATSAGTVRFLTLEDETDLAEGHLAAAAYRRLDTVFGTPGPYLVVARVAVHGGLTRLEIEEALPFHRRAAR
jgi:DNA polymerase III alpha subunit